MLQEVLDRFVNPIHLLGMRSTLRTIRYFVVFTISLLLVSLVMFFAIVLQIDSAPSEIGRILFIIFCVVQLSLVSLVFPAFSCTAIIQEKDRQTYDLLISSQMKPWEIVWGKFLVAFHNAFLFLVTPLPIVVISFLFGGVTVSAIFFVYYFLFYFSALLIIYSVYISTVAKSIVRAIITVYLTNMLVASFIIPGFIALLAAYLWGDNSLERMLEQLSTVDVALFIVNNVFVFSVLFLLPFLISANHLKLPSDNRSTSLRLFSLYALGGNAAFIWAWIYSHFSSISWDNLSTHALSGYSQMIYSLNIAIYIGIALFLLVCAIVFSTEDPIPKPFVFTRAKRAVDKSKWRYLLPNFALKLLLPGSMSGALYVTGLTTVLCTSLLYLFDTIIGWNDQLLSVHKTVSLHGAYGAPLLIMSFLFAVSMFGCFLSFRISNVKWRRAILVTLLVVVMLLPMYMIFSLTVFGEFEVTLWNGQYLSPSLAYFSRWLDLDQLKASRTESLDLFLYGVPLYWVFIVLYAAGGGILFLSNTVSLSRAVRKQRRQQLGERR